MCGGSACSEKGGQEQAGMVMAMAMAIPAQAQAARWVVPSEFLCPISLEIMEDPVILCTGITYERRSIRKWLSKGHSTCPVTMQHLPTLELIPNSAAAQIIQSWIIRTTPSSADRQPPESPCIITSDGSSSSSISRCGVSNVEQLLGVVADGEMAESRRVGALRELEMKVRDSTESSRVLAEAGAVSVLASIISSSSNPGAAFSELAITVLSLLPMTDSDRRTLSSSSSSPRLLNAITDFLHGDSSSHSKLSAAILVATLARSRRLRRMIRSTNGLMETFTKLLQQNQRSSLKVAILRAVMAACLERGGRVRAVECGMGAAVAELLVADGGGAPQTREVCEHALGVVEVLCKCAEGRAAFCYHPLAIPAIAAQIFQLSSFATHSAVSSLRLIVGSKHDLPSRRKRDLQRRVAEACEVARLNFKPNSLAHTHTRDSPKHLVVQQFLELCNPKYTTPST